MSEPSSILAAPLARRVLTLSALTMSALMLSACTQSEPLPQTNNYSGCADEGACACVSDLDCSVGERCDQASGACAPIEGCQSDAQCPEGQRCQDAACVPIPPDPRDGDGDGVPDDEDGCPGVSDPDQLDLDQDDLGDACDDDVDGDGLVNGIDNCRRAYNPMQEDPDGDGLGIACEGGDRQRPFSVAGGVARQHLDTVGRPDTFAASCGGGGAPEVVYAIPLDVGERVSAQVKAGHGLALQLWSPGEVEVACAAGPALEAVALEAGVHLLVVDGQGSGDAGPVTVTASIDRGTAGGDATRLDMGQDAQATWAGLFNDDTVLDLVTVNTAQGTVSVRLGAHSGGFQALQSFEVGEGPVAVWGGDLNSDGAPDLAVALDGEGALAVLFNEGAGVEGGVALSAALKLDVGGDPAAVWGGDLNNSGAPDLVSANSADGTISVLLNDGLGGFAAQQTFEGGEGPAAVWGGDLNNDGAADLAVANTGGGVGAGVSIMQGRGDGGFEQVGELSTGQGPAAVWGGDLNNDGAPELAVVHDGGTVGGVLAVYANEGGGVFGAPTSHPIGAGPVAVWGGDLNNDGIGDLATANFGGSSLSLLLGDGQGGFGDSREVGMAEPPVYVWGGDLNNDAAPELMAPTGAGVDIFDSEARAFGPPRAAEASGLEAVWGGDLNNDGAPDMAVVNREAGTLSVRMGLGNGDFGPASTFEVGEGPVAVWGGDLNNNGAPDLVVANTGQIGDTSGVVSLLLNDGAGGFAAVESLTTDLIPTSIFGDQDFNGDGLLDLAVATRGSDTISLLMATGPGRFDDGHVSIPVGSGPISVWGGDLNNDGALDLATANEGGDSISVLSGSGDGTFTRGADLPVEGSGPMSLWGGDLNGDGFMDLATANAGSANMSVIVGRGEGLFKAARHFGTGGGPGMVWGGDLMNDGLSDLITTSADGVRVYTGYNAGGFVGTQTLPVGQGARGVWGADFDSDGAPDFATTNAEGTQVRLSRLGSPLDLAGVRLVDHAAPACPPTRVTGQPIVLLGEVVFPTARLLGDCRVERLEISLNLTPQATTGIVITLAAEHLPILKNRATLVSSVEALPPDDRWTPEMMPGFARFEGAPAAGLWRLSARSGACKRANPACLPIFRSATLHINPQTPDPLDAGRPRMFCTSGSDQPDARESICRWSGASVDAIIDREDDVDLLLLDGPNGGGLAAGQTLTVDMTVEQGQSPSLGLFLFGARRPLAVATPSAPGRSTLRITIPDQLAGRYLELRAHARPGQTLPLTYNLAATIQ